ncbi:hypothetical protein Lal_00017972 [Lupinus albus]|nr:hypothetical protein Lal_00017972 [Lupinus albus]
MANGDNPLSKDLYSFTGGIFPPLAGMKYDLRKVGEVYYDVKIRGLTPNGKIVGDKGVQG